MSGWKRRPFCGFELHYYELRVLLCNSGNVIDYIKFPSFLCGVRFFIYSFDILVCFIFRWMFSIRYTLHVLPRETRLPGSWILPQFLHALVVVIGLYKSSPAFLLLCIVDIYCINRFSLADFVHLSYGSFWCPAYFIKVLPFWTISLGPYVPNSEG